LVFDDKYNNCSDQELLNKYLESGEPGYVGILYKRYGHLVLGLCIKYLKNTMEAEDAVIHIFTSLLEDLKRHKVKFFKSWLYVYSKNHCLMELRKRQSMLKKELDLHENIHLVVDFEDPEHLKEKETQIQLMEIAIGGLNHLQKQCIELFYLKNKSYIEITGLTGLTANDVKSHIQNGKRNLKIRIEALMNERQNK
jgi:RNA polymerase sigma factor (sigma-70 family)